MKKILVTTDGSNNAEKALLETKEFAKVLNLKVVILNVIDDVILSPYASPYSSIQYNSIQAENALRKLSQKILDEALTLFDDFDGEVETKIKKGDPADVIIEEAEDEDYEYVVMGSRGLGTFSRAILGSVSSRVLNHTKTNVLIVK